MPLPPGNPPVPALWGGAAAECGRLFPAGAGGNARAFWRFRRASDLLFAAGGAAPFSRA